MWKYLVDALPVILVLYVLHCAANMEDEAALRHGRIEEHLQAISRQLSRLEAPLIEEDFRKKYGMTSDEYLAKDDAERKARAERKLIAHPPIV